MFKRIMVYAKEDKGKTILATVFIFVAVLMSVIPFLLAYQVIAPLVMGEAIEKQAVLLRVAGVLLCLVLHGVFYVVGLSLSHDAAYHILERIRVTMQERMEKLPLGVIQEKGVGMLKRLFVDDVESMEALLAHAIPEGVGNIMIPVVIFFML